MTASAATQPLFATDNVTSGSPDGAPAFLGNVYYVSDPTTGAPLAGWPPKLPNKGFRGLRGFKAGGGGGRGEEGQRRWSAAFPSSFRGRVDPRRFFGAAAGSSMSPQSADDEEGAPSTPSTADDDAAVDTPAAAAAKREGPSAYFTSRGMAESWRDAIRRPRGLFEFHRRRLWRPSDIPLGPVDVSACSMGEVGEKRRPRSTVHSHVSKAAQLR